MRILFAAIYLALAACRMWLGSRMQPAVIERVTARSGDGRALQVPALSVAVTVVAFVQFQVLAGYFPWLLVLVLAATSLILLSATYILRALLGLDTNDQRRKEFCLTFVWGAMAGSSLGYIIVLLIILLLLYPVGVLWIFFSHYPDFHEKVVKLAFFHFCVPAILIQVLTCTATSGLLASPHVDDDVRNSGFLLNLNNSIIATVLVLYPAYLISQGSTRVLASPGLWILLSTPTLIFIVLAFFPFLAGAFRYRLEVQSRLNWRRKWIAQMLDLSTVTSQGLGDDERRRLMEVLNKEIESRLSENRVFYFLRENLFGDRVQTSSSRAGTDTVPKLTHDPSGDLMVEGQAEAVPRGSYAHASRVDRIREHLPPFSVRLQRNRSFEAAVDILEQEQASFIDWDVSFRNIKELIDLQNAAKDLEWADFVEYLKAKSEGYARDDREARAFRKRNAIVSFIISVATTGASTAIVQGFKSYEPQIFDFIGGLISAG